MCLQLQVWQFVIDFEGMSRPGYMLDMNVDTYEHQMKVNYLGTVYTVREAIQAMVNQKIKGKVVMVSSTAGFVSFLGYSAYSPTKAAIRCALHFFIFHLKQHLQNLCDPK